MPQQDQDYIRKLEEENRRLKEKLRLSETAPPPAQKSDICLIASSPVPMLLCEPTGTVREWNDPFLELFGLKKSDISPSQNITEINRLWEEYDSHGNKLELSKSLPSILTKENRSKNTTIKIIRQDGSERWVNISASCIFSSNGSVSGILITCLDITNRITSNSLLSENRALFYSLVQSIPHNIFSKNREGTFTFANREYCKTENLTLDQIIGKTDFDLHPEEYAEKYRKDDTRVMETEEVYQIIETHYPKSGSPTYVQVVKAPLYNSEHEVSGMIGIFWDITEQKIAESALKKSEAQIRELARNIPGVIFQSTKPDNGDFNFTFISEQSEKILGIAHDDPDFYITLLSRMSEDQRLAYHDSVKKSMEYKKIHEFTFQYSHPNGRKMWIQTIASPSRNGHEIIYNGVLLDITSQKNTEERNRHLEEQFYSAQRMKAIGTLAGGIAHNINNILMGIQGRLSLIALEPENSESCQENFSLISQYVSNASDLTRDLLAFARGGKYESKVTDINELIKRENRLFKQTRREITILENLSEDIQAVEVDKSQIRQALLNLYINASQAMPGGGTISVSTRERVCDAETARANEVEPGNYIEVIIEDTGVGMDEETKQKVFEPFFSRRHHGQGTGLGLSSVYGIIKNHGGYINIYSEENIGSAIHFYLPASDLKPEEEESPGAGITGGDQTILLIDDEEMILDVGQKLLEKIGYTVLIADSGSKAIDIFRKRKDEIDCIIIDIIMPQLTGQETAIALRDINPDIPLLFSSGYSRESAMHKSISDLGNGFIQKPYTLQELSLKIREVLNSSS